MDIIWHGHCCFEIRAAEGTIVVEPLPALMGAGLEADIVVLGHQRDEREAAAAVGGDPFVVSGPGEYEVRGVFVAGVRVAHASTTAGAHRRSTVYGITAEGITVCHLGDLSRPPTQEQVEAVGVTDVLLVPVGGAHTMGPELAVEAVNLAEPSVVVPMLYRSPDHPELEPVDKFLAAMGAEDVEPSEALRISRHDLRPEPQVVLLAPRR